MEPSASILPSGWASRVRWCSIAARVSLSHALAAAAPPDASSGTARSSTCASDADRRSRTRRHALEQGIQSDQSADI